MTQKLIILKLIFISTYISFSLTSENTIAPKSGILTHKNYTLLQPWIPITDLQQLILGYLDCWSESSKKNIATNRNTLAISPDGSRIAYITEQKTVHLWDTQTDTETEIFNQVPFEATALAFSPDNNCIAIGVEERPVYQCNCGILIYDVLTQKVTQDIVCPTDKFSEMSFSTPHALLLSCYKDGSQFASKHTTKTGLTLIDVTGRQKNNFIQMPFKNPPYKCILLFDKNYLIEPENSSTITIRNIATGYQTPLRNIDTKSVTLSVACSADGNYLASAESDYSVRIWNIPQNVVNYTDIINSIRLIGHKGSVLSVAFSPNGKYLASGSCDKTVRVWDLSKKEEIAKIEGHSGNIHTVLYASNGNTIISASLDNTIRIWTNTAELIRNVDQSYFSDL